MDYKEKLKENNKKNQDKIRDQLAFFDGEYNGWWYYQYFASMFNDHSPRGRR